jgi:hypothetical protein
MLPAKCQEYLGLLKEHFVWLFDEFGFVILQIENGHMDSCSFLMQGEDCRLFVAIDRGRIGLTQITMVPSRSHEIVNIPGLRWYALADVANYLIGHFPDWQEVKQQLANARTQTLQETLIELSTRYHSLWPDVMTIFREDRFELEKARLEPAIEEGRSRLRYPN